MKPMPHVKLHIEHLILHGLSPGDRHRAELAFTQELSRLLTERGVPEAFAQGGSLARLDAGSVTVRPGSGPDVVGAQAAQAAYAHLARGGEGR